MENNQLNLMGLLKKKVHHLIRKKKIYQLISKEEIFYKVVAEGTGKQNNGFTKIAEFNNFIDVETLFVDIKYYKMHFEGVEYFKIGFRSK